MLVCGCGYGYGYGYVNDYACACVCCYGCAPARRPSPTTLPSGYWRRTKRGRVPCRSIARASRICSSLQGSRPSLREGSPPRGSFHSL